MGRSCLALDDEDGFRGGQLYQGDPDAGYPPMKAGRRREVILRLDGDWGKPLGRLAGPLALCARMEHDGAKGGAPVESCGVRRGDDRCSGALV